MFLRSRKMSSRSNLHDHYSWDELVTKALKLYRKGRYDEALEALNGAEEGRPGGANTEILDLKAATYARLEKPEAALADARRMLVLDKEYVPGYLRTGRILEGMEKNEVALKIYERGIRFCSKRDSRYETLKTKHADLKQKIAPPDGINFFNILPVELLDIIFGFLPLEVACKCLRVSKQWKQIMTGWPRFWFHLDLSGARKAVKPETLMRYVAYSQNGIRTAVLKNVTLQATPLLSKFTGKCQSLEELTLLSGGSLKDSLVKALTRAKRLRSLTLSDKAPVNLETLGDIMNSCPSLANVCIDTLNVTRSLPGVTVFSKEDYPNLRSWKIGSVGASNSTLRALSPLATGLKSLSISRSAERSVWFEELELITTRYNLLETLELNQILLGTRYQDDRFGPTPEDLTFPHGLRHLTIQMSNILSEDALALRQNLPQLQSLTLRSASHTLLPDKVERILACDIEHKDPSLLTTFKIWLPLWTKQQVLELLAHPRLTKLQHLGLMDCHDLDDSIADVIAEQGQGLRSLHLPTSKISGAGLKKLIQSCPSLASVNVDYCTRMGDDALQWTRDQGVAISRKMT